LFGCNILPLGQLGEWNAAYEEKFAKLFNLATTTFCLSEYRSEKGEYRFGANATNVWRRPPPDRVLAFCRKHGIAMKGQPLLADSWHPEWAKKMTPDDARALYREYFTRVAERYGKDVLMFDVVNEAFLCKGRNKRRGWNFPLYTEDLGYVEWAFETAQSLFPPECRLTINEAATGDAYFRKIKALLDKGIRLDGIGFQVHYFSANALQAHFDLKRHPAALRETYVKYGRLNRPLYISEITIPTTLASGAEGEALQACAVENLYRLWFSVPAMAGITYWNLCDGAAWKTEGRTLAGLLDPQMREKPAYQTLCRLIQREWNTQAQTVSDAQGKASFRGFYGTYDVVARIGDKTQAFEIKLGKDTPTHQLKLK
ncbi:MAG: endo-1,4-beta-xylanase, partial [Kiritimatiellia bacterium]|nr:endo-1,4-beta-xylanase [Kiritimatiellia bacterium]